MEAATTNSQENPALIASGQQESLITLRIDKQLFGIPVHLVQDVLRPHRVTPIPLSSPNIAGSMNLRGRTVTVIDMRKRLGLSPIQDDEEHMNIVVEDRDELFSFKVDKVGDVLPLPKEQFEKCPPNLDSHWQEMATGVYRLKEELLVVLDIDQLLSFNR